MLSVTGTLLNVTSKVFNIHAVVRDSEEGRDLVWVIEPELWKMSPYIKLVPGRFVRLAGRREMSAVGQRDVLRASIRYRAMEPVVLLDEIRPSPSVRSSSAMDQYQATLSRPKSQHFENQVDRVITFLNNPPTDFAWTKYGHYYCFDLGTIAKAIPEMPESDVNRCLVTLIRKGEIAVINSAKGLYATIGHETFLAPALLMIVHGEDHRLSVNSNDDGCFTLDDLIAATQKHFLGRFNVPYHRLVESVHRLIADHLIIKTENGTYRRPYYVRGNSV